MVIASQGQTRIVYRSDFFFGSRMHSRQPMHRSQSISQKPWRPGVCAYCSTRAMQSTGQTSMHAPHPVHRSAEITANSLGTLFRSMLVIGPGCSRLHRNVPRPLMPADPVRRGRPFRLRQADEQHALRLGRLRLVGPLRPRREQLRRRLPVPAGPLGAQPPAKTGLLPTRAGDHGASSRTAAQSICGGAPPRASTASAGPVRHAVHGD